MKIVVADAGSAYDGATPSTHPMDGAERAVVGLASALAARGHEVTVLNGCADPVTRGGVAYHPLPTTWHEAKPVDVADALIAVRKPALLGAVTEVGRRILWPMAHPDYLTWPAHRIHLDKYNPSIAYLGATQMVASARPGGAVVAPGVSRSFRPGLLSEPTERPEAVVVTHPMHGLDQVLTLWEDRIQPEVSGARLTIYSALLRRAVDGEVLPASLEVLAGRVKALAERDVVVRAPLAEDGMAGVYRSARVLLYPGHAKDMACWALGEAQACGLPAVAKPLGAAEERLANGEGGYIVPDGEAFANLAIQILSDATLAKGIAAAAGEPARLRTWDAAARDFELLMA
ncbi:MAG: glycosyltransferase [Rhodospirillum sp.]|nr:glycosyltransferase [Rhodospirillum sp.]MCF8488649.1 glycosyltransferase [Rhodospirillum sp.]MCF8501746.1 glycosyltransferase [Rhodospirillum sp.]